MERKLKPGDPVQSLDYMCDGQLVGNPKVGAIIPTPGDPVRIGNDMFIVTHTAVRQVPGRMASALSYVRPAKVIGVALEDAASALPSSVQSFGW